MASELECSGVYLGSCSMGCILKGCLLFIDIMIAEVREGLWQSSSIGSVLLQFFWRGKKRHGEKRIPPRARTESLKLGWRWEIKKKKMRSWKSGTPAGSPASFWPLSDFFYNKDAACLRRIYWTAALKPLLIGRIVPPSWWTHWPITWRYPAVTTPSHDSLERGKDAKKKKKFLKYLKINKSELTRRLKSRNMFLFHNCKHLKSFKEIMINTFFCVQQLLY